MYRQGENPRELDGHDSSSRRLRRRAISLEETYRGGVRPLHRGRQQLLAGVGRQDDEDHRRDRRTLWPLTGVHVCFTGTLDATTGGGVTAAGAQAGSRRQTWRERPRLTRCRDHQPSRFLPSRADVVGARHRERAEEALTLDGEGRQPLARHGALRVWSDFAARPKQSHSDVLN